MNVVTDGNGVEIIELASLNLNLDGGSTNLAGGKLALGRTESNEIVFLKKHSGAAGGDCYTLADPQTGSSYGPRIGVEEADALISRQGRSNQQTGTVSEEGVVETSGIVTGEREPRPNGGLLDGFMNSRNARKEKAILNEAYAKVAKMFNRTPETVAEVIDHAAVEVPTRLYRGQPGWAERHVRTGWGTIDRKNLDGYLGAIFRHTASTEGGLGASLTTSPTRAGDFARKYKDGIVLKIHTTEEIDNFRTAADIIKNEGPRLVREEEISKETFRNSIAQLINHSGDGLDEFEVFYIYGDVPDKYIDDKVGRPS